MTSKVGIANLALADLGADPIADFAEGSEEAKLVTLRYDAAVDTVLRAHPWNSAIARAQLAKALVAPLFGYASAYQLPSDPYCLRALELNDDPELVFKIEGRLLVTDETSALLRYIARVTDTSQYDALLVEALAARLAYDLAYSITGNASLAEAKLKVYEKKIAEARRVDSQEGTPDSITANEWLDSRFGA